MSFIILSGTVFAAEYTAEEKKGILRQFSCRNVLDNGAKSFNQ